MRIKVEKTASIRHKEEENKNRSLHQLPIPRGELFLPTLPNTKYWSLSSNTSSIPEWHVNKCAVRFTAQQDMTVLPQ